MGNAAPRDDVAAPNFTTLGSDPEHLVLQPAERRRRHRRPLAPEKGLAFHDARGSPHRQIKIFRRDPVAAPEDHRLLQDGFQLAHVAAPWVLLQPSERPPRDPTHRHAVALVELGEEVRDEKDKIFASRAKRRDLQHDPAQAVVEILPERPVLDRITEQEADLPLGSEHRMPQHSARHHAPAHQPTRSPIFRSKGKSRGTRTAWRISTSAPVRGCV